MAKSNFPLIMKSLAAGTTLACAVFTVLCFCTDAPWILPTAISFGTTAYHLLMRLAVGYIVPKLTNYRFDYRTRWFLPRQWEAGFYRKLKVRNWKGKIPTYAPMQFSLRENTLYRVIQNTCGAEIVHEIIMVLSFLPLLTVPLFGEFAVFFLTSLGAAMYDSIFVLAQRYNRPRLVRIHEKQEAKPHE